MKSSIEETFSSLKGQFRGDLLRPHDGEFARAQAVWNAMAARTPGLIARCADVADVQAAVRAATAAGVLTAVRCGGHSLAGFSTCDGGLVIDLSRMRQVLVDGNARRGRFAGGCLLGSIDIATQATRTCLSLRRSLAYGRRRAGPRRRIWLAHPPARALLRQR